MDSENHKRRTITLEHILLIVALACICVAQYSIRYTDNPNIPSAESKILGPVNLALVCCALGLRRKYGKVAVWAAVAADIIVTGLVAMVSAL